MTLGRTSGASHDTDDGRDKAHTHLVAPSLNITSYKILKL